MYNPETGNLISREKEFIKMSSRPLNERICKENLFLIKRVFENHNVDFRLALGTLLGALRNGKFIVGDSDVDFFLLKQEQAKVLSSVKELEQNGFCFIRKTNDLFSFERRGEYIDLCFFEQKTFLDKWLNRGLCQIGHWCIRINLDYFKGFDEVVLYGKRFKTLKDSLTWIRFTYGFAWKVPRPKKGNTRTLTCKILLCYDKWLNRWNCFKRGDYF
jgi:hypothetical protein